MAKVSGDQLSAWDDRALVERCQQELPLKLDAYQELLRRHEPLVFNTCLKMIGSYPDAEEICQDAFVQVFHKIGQFEGRSSFKTWLFRIVYNLCLRRREVLSKRTYKESTAGEEYAADLHAKALEAEQKIDLSESVKEAMDQLEDEQRRVIVLKYISGLTLQEIADVQSVSLSAAKMRLYRSLEKFKETYLRIERGSR